MYTDVYLSLEGNFDDFLQILTINSPHILSQISLLTSEPTRDRFKLALRDLFSQAFYRNINLETYTSAQMLIHICDHFLNTTNANIVYFDYLII